MPALRALGELVSEFGRGGIEDERMGYGAGLDPPGADLGTMIGLATGDVIGRRGAIGLPPFGTEHRLRQRHADAAAAKVGMPLAVAIAHRVDVARECSRWAFHVPLPRLGGSGLGGRSKSLTSAGSVS